MKRVFNFKKGEPINKIKVMKSFLDAYFYDSEGGEEIRKNRKIIIDIQEVVKKKSKR